MNALETKLVRGRTNFAAFEKFRDSCEMSNREMLFSELLIGCLYEVPINRFAAILADAEASRDRMKAAYAEAVPHG